jgi:hypothetical protein
MEIVETYWPLDDDGDVRYAHVDLDADRVTGEECTRKPVVSGNPEPVMREVKDCPRCGNEYEPANLPTSRLCPACIKTEQEEQEAEDDFADLDDEDDFADLDDL